MPDASSAVPRWWGRFSLKEDERGYWRVGPLSLAIERSRQEWRVERHSQDDPAAGECRVALGSDESVGDDGVTTHRFSFERTGETLWLTPRLADRAVVVTPESPFYVTAGQQILLFCSTPLWMRIEVGDDKTLLEEFPIFRPPDTWFGPSTREGELCYATTTAARLRREDILPRPHRAITELRIRNDADDTLPIERVNLSVPYLSLYAATDGILWSDRVTLHRRADGSRIELQIADRAPENLQARAVSAARVATRQNVVVRAFGALFA